METRKYRRRVTGELALDPDLHRLVMTSAAVLDRLLCAGSSPIEEETAARRRELAGVAEERLFAS